MAVAHLLHGCGLVVTCLAFAGPSALCWLQAEEDGHTALDRDAQSSDPLCVMQGPAGRRLLSQAVSAVVATRFNNFSKVTSSQLTDHSHEVWKSLLVYLVLSSL